MSKKPTTPGEADNKAPKPVPPPDTREAAVLPETPPPPDGNGVARRFVQRHRRTLKGLSNK